jgi:hypothetical protein
MFDPAGKPITVAVDSRLLVESGSAASTMGEILKRRGMIHPRARAHSCTAAPQPTGAVRLTIEVSASRAS